MLVNIQIVKIKITQRNVDYFIVIKDSIKVKSFTFWALTLQLNKLYSIEFSNLCFTIKKYKKWLNKEINK